MRSGLHDLIRTSSVGGPGELENKKLTYETCLDIAENELSELDIFKTLAVLTDW